jgi:hypothetical protein
MTKSPQRAESAPPGGSSWSTIKTVAWAFFGVRKRNDHESSVRVSPLHVLVAGFIGVIVLVGILIALVNWVAA